MALGAAEEPDLALVDVGLDPACHGVRPRPPRDDDVGQSEALGEQEVAGCVGSGHGGCESVFGRKRRKYCFVARKDVNATLVKVKVNKVAMFI